MTNTRIEIKNRVSAAANNLLDNPKISKQYKASTVANFLDGIPGERNHLNLASFVQLIISRDLGMDKSADMQRKIMAIYSMLKIVINHSHNIINTANHINFKEDEAKLYEYCCGYDDVLYIGLYLIGVKDDSQFNDETKSNLDAIKAQLENFIAHRDDYSRGLYKLFPSAKLTTSATKVILNLDAKIKNCTSIIKDSRNVNDIPKSKSEQDNTKAAIGSCINRDTKKAAYLSINYLRGDNKISLLDVINKSDLKEDETLILKYLVTGDPRNLSNKPYHNDPNLHHLRTMLVSSCNNFKTPLFGTSNHFSQELIGFISGIKVEDSTLVTMYEEPRRQNNAQQNQVTVGFPANPSNEHLENDDFVITVPGEINDLPKPRTLSGFNPAARPVPGETIDLPKPRTTLSGFNPAARPVPGEINDLSKLKTLSGFNPAARPVPGEINDLSKLKTLSRFNPAATPQDGTGVNLPNNAQKNQVDVGFPANPSNEHLENDDFVITVPGETKGNPSQYVVEVVGIATLNPAAGKSLHNVVNNNDTTRSDQIQVNRNIRRRKHFRRGKTLNADNTVVTYKNRNLTKQLTTTGWKYVVRFGRDTFILGSKPIHRTKLKLGQGNNGEVLKYFNSNNHEFGDVIRKNDIARIINEPHVQDFVNNLTAEMAIKAKKYGVNILLNFWVSAGSDGKSQKFVGPTNLKLRDLKQTDLMDPETVEKSINLALEIQAINLPCTDSKFGNMMTYKDNQGKNVLVRIDLDFDFDIFAKMKRAGKMISIESVIESIEIGNPGELPLAVNLNDDKNAKIKYYTSLLCTKEGKLDRKLVYLYLCAQGMCGSFLGFIPEDHLIPKYIGDRNTFFTIQNDGFRGFLSRELIKYNLNVTSEFKTYFVEFIMAWKSIDPGSPKNIQAIKNFMSVLAANHEHVKTNILEPRAAQIANTLV